MSYKDRRIKLKKVTIVKRPKGRDEDWVYIYLNNAKGFYISFEELYHIVKLISECEDEKYPPPRYKGRKMVLEFLRDTIMTDFPFEALADAYKIPRRT